MFRIGMLLSLGVNNELIRCGIVLSYFDIDFYAYWNCQCNPKDGG